MTTFSVPFVDLKERWEVEQAELMEIIRRVASQGHFVLTEEVAEFEAKVQLFTGARHCVGLNSGTDALILGLRAMGIGPGDEVITAPNSFVASAGAIAAVGATPAFADIRDDQTMDPIDLERRITPRTRAIMPVHWTGRISDMDALGEVAARHGVPLVEDSAQSMGAYYHGKHGGTFGRFGAFSAHPLKNLNAMGDGGFLLTDDDELAEKVRLIRNHGLLDRDTCLEFGLNSRLDAIQAAILSYRLDRLPDVVAVRRRHAQLYRELITVSQVYMPEEKPDERGACVLFVVQAENRDALQAHLRSRGVEAVVYYGTPLHLQPAARHLGYQPGDFPVAERQAARVLALPHHQCLSDEQIRFVASEVNAFYR